ncbi:MAG: hypothetical protein COA94_03165 [Rickettsiales bacterium]|nr:MAG: hypothetical protein COA94_03165 [Rickettsiales bacterium]
MTKEIKILSVNRYPLNTTLTRLWKKNFNCTIDEAPTGRDALKMFTKTEYNLMFIRELPDMLSTDIALQIRSSETELNREPAIISVLIPRTPANQDPKYLDAGIDYVLEDPLIGDKIEEVVKKFGLGGDW